MTRPTCPGSAAYRPQKVSLEFVKCQMFQESRNPLLVYATEEALTAPRAPLSDALQRFVRVENKTFSHELSRQAEEGTSDTTAPAGDMSLPPMSPSKRKYRSGSVDSMATNRASLGNSDEDSRAGDFDDIEIIEGIDGSLVGEPPTIDSDMAQDAILSQTYGSHEAQGTANASSSKCIQGSSSSHTHKNPKLQGDVVSIGQGRSSGWEPSPIKTEMQETGRVGPLFSSRTSATSVVPGAASSDSDSMELDVSTGDPKNRLGG